MKAFIRHWRHRVAHWLGWNEGRVESWWEDGTHLKVGFRCRTCGQFSGVHEPGLPSSRWEGFD